MMLAHVAIPLLAAFALAQGPANEGTTCISALTVAPLRASGCPTWKAPLRPDVHARRQDPDRRSVALSGHWAYRWTHMYEDGSRLVGGGLGIVLNDRSRIELVGFGTAEPSRYSTLELRLAYGGLQIDHEILRSGRWTVGAAGTVALGTFSVEETQADTEERTGVWLAEPEVFVGAHFGEHARLTVGASHRWVRGVEGDIPNRSDGDASGPALAVRLAVR